MRIKIKYAFISVTFIVFNTSISNMIFCYDWYAPSATEDFQARLAQSIALQAKCLALDWQRLIDQTAQLTALKGLFVAQTALGANGAELAATGYDTVDDLVADVVNKDTTHPAKWERVMRVPMRFNRLVLFSPWQFHTAAPGFGTDPESARLVMLLFFARAGR